MKLVLCVLVFSLSFSTFALNIQSGDYKANIVELSKSPNACKNINYLTDYMIIDNHDKTVTVVPVLIIGDMRLDLYDISSLHRLAGNTMHDTATFPKLQIMDLNEWFGIDAVVTNRQTGGSPYIWKNDTFVSYTTGAQPQTCEGTMCDIAAQIFFGPGGSYPCMFSPSKTTLNFVE